MNYDIRLATHADLPDILRLRDESRQTMRQNGNSLQWPEGYPTDNTFRRDIEQQHSYIMETTGEDGLKKAVATFAFIPSPEPTYQQIFDGAWLNDAPYHVIHRIASSSESHGVLQSILQFCFGQTENIRIDTHRDNSIMRHLLQKNGFWYCGIIHLANGDERMAYQRTVSTPPTPTEITSISQPEVQLFSMLTEAQLRNRLEPQQGIFIAESPKVIRTALNKGYKPVALLCEKKHIHGDAADIVCRCADIPIYIGERELLSRLTGYTLTRGVLCAMRRQQQPSVEEICSRARRIVVIDGVTDTTNIGAIFRSAAALGIDGILLTRTSCDPLNRRAIRVSMGTVFLVPWTWLDMPVGSLHKHGFKTAAMALSNDSIPLDAPALKQETRLAIIMGTEGDGLSRSVIDDADYVVRIPMWHGVDSLNVAAAAAVAFWELRVG